MDSLPKPEKKFLYTLSILLLVLVLFDKGMTLDMGKKAEDKKANFLNTANFSPIPEIDDPSSFEKKPSPVPEFFPDPVLEHSEKSQGIYFIKFYGSGKNTHSRLVRVTRKVRGGLKTRVRTVWKELESGPKEEERNRGVISALPGEYKLIKKIRYSEGILFVSFSENFADGVGNQILQDRIDQINYTFFEIPEIKGIVYFFDGKRKKYLGKENLQIPDMYQKGNRRYVKW